MISRYKPVKQKRPGPARRGRLRDPDYLMYITTFGCIVCHLGVFVRSLDGAFVNGDASGQVSPTEAAHVGVRGLSQKCSDREALPLCAQEHHRTGPESAHVLGKRFWIIHNLDRVALIAELNAMYERERAA